jgi:hypothetical protein
MEGKKGGSLEMGLSEQDGFSVDPKAHGQDTMGKDQKPQATPESSVSEKGKKFKIC